MDPSLAEAAPRQPWPSLWIATFVSLLAQLAICQFFSFGQRVPYTIDVNPSNVWKYAYHFPPRGEFLTLNWFGIANLPPTLNPFSFAVAHLPHWLFFTAYAPLAATAALFAMVAFLRELDLPRPAALLGGLVYAWQGDLLPFVFPGHYGYITTWAFFALAAWAALRAQRHGAYALIAGASCGMMIGLQPDRGSIASLLIAALYTAPALYRRVPGTAQFRSLALCIGVAALVSLAAFLALFQSYIIGVKLGAATDRDQAFVIATQYSLGPAETLSYLVPGVFGWTNTNASGPYWGWIGQTPGYDDTHQGTRNLNLGISTTGTVASLLGLLGVYLMMPGAARFFGSARLAGTITANARAKATATRGAAPRDWTRAAAPDTSLAFTDRQLFFGRLFVVLGALSLVLAWGYHTSLYRPLFALPLMDKWRNPLKWLEIFNFAAAVLAAYGAAQLVRSLADVTQRYALNLYFAMTVALLFLFFAISYLLTLPVTTYLNGGYQPAEIAAILHTLHLSLGFAFLLGVALWLCLAGMWHGDRLQTWDIVNPLLRQGWQRALEIQHRPATLGLVLGALIALQLGWVAFQFISPISLARFTASNQLLDSLASEGPLVRVAVPQPQNPLLNYYLQNQFAALRISSIDISAASRIPDALTAFVDAFSGHTARLWLMGGVKNVAIGQADLASLRQDPEVAANIVEAGGFTLTPSQDGQPTHALVRLRDYFNKATFIPSAQLGTDEENLETLGDTTWNPRSSILLAAQPGTPPPTYLAPKGHPAAPMPAVGIDITRYSPHAIDLHLARSPGGYVLINDQYDPDWQVQINGRPAPLLRADYLLRAVEVPPGESTVALRYVAHYRFGLPLPVIIMNDFSDAITLLAFGVGALLIRRAQRPFSLP